MNPAGNRLFWLYQKNKHLIDALLLHRAPEFVYRTRPGPIENDIPAFTFHLASPEWFDEQCRHLVESGYRTLTAEEFLHALTRPGRVAGKPVYLTFDDGLKHVWTVAWPLLKKYGLHATCYLIPGCIPDTDSRVRPTLDDVWQGTATIAEIMGIHRDEPALATWQEIRIMHESGVIDFHSHTMNHALVPVSDQIDDFVHPGFDPYFYGNIHIPMYTINGNDVISRKPLLGMPIYQAMPRMQAEARYFDDEGLRTHCVEEVQRQGGRLFFDRRDWRSTMSEIVSRYRNQCNIKERYETPQERDATITEDLARSREIIEGRLPGKRVTQLCYPWYDANQHAINASRKTGYQVNLFGMRKGRYTNRPGQDPFGVVRSEEIYLQRLPGKSRNSIIQLFKHMYGLRALPAQLFPDGRPCVE